MATLWIVQREKALRRKARLLAMFALAYLAQGVGVEASVTCERIEDLRTISDERALGLLATYQKTLGDADFQFRAFDKRFVLAYRGNQDCKSSNCYYRLLDLRSSKVEERFSFKGTGVVLTFMPIARDDELRDFFFQIAFEISAQTHISVGLPETGDSIPVSVWVPQQIRMPTC